jgi:predicted transcriptional regulator
MSIAQFVVGRKLDHADIGKKARIVIAEAGLYKTDIANRMNIPPSLLSGLLGGYRVWTPELAAQFDRAIESLTKERKK